MLEARLGNLAYSILEGKIKFFVEFWEQCKEVYKDGGV